MRQGLEHIGEYLNLHILDSSELRCTRPCAVGQTRTRILLIESQQTPPEEIDCSTSPYSFTRYRT